MVDNGMDCLYRNQVLVAVAFLARELPPRFCFVYMRMSVWAQYELRTKRP